MSKRKFEMGTLAVIKSRQSIPMERKDVMSIHRHFAQKGTLVKISADFFWSIDDPDHVNIEVILNGKPHIAAVKQESLRLLSPREKKLYELLYG